MRHIWSSVYRNWSSLDNILMTVNVEIYSLDNLLKQFMELWSEYTAQKKNAFVCKTIQFIIWWILHAIRKHITNIHCVCFRIEYSIYQIMNCIVLHKNALFFVLCFWIYSNHNSITCHNWSSVDNISMIVNVEVYSFDNLLKQWMKKFVSETEMICYNFHQIIDNFAKNYHCKIKQFKKIIQR